MNTEIEIPKLYRTETLDINGNKVEIKGYRGNDYAHVRTLEKIGTRVSELSIKLNRLTTNKTEDTTDSDWSKDELKELNKLQNEMIDIKADMQKIVYILAQRGIKRFYYPGLNTGEIDKKPDIEVDEVDITRIHQVMAKISSDNPDFKGDVKGKAGKKGRKKK